MQEIPKSFYSKSMKMMVLWSGSHWSMLIDAWGIKDWAFYKVTPHQATFQFLLMKDQKIDCNEEMNRTGVVILCMKCFCCILHLYRKLGSSGWIFLQNGKWWLFNLVPQDTGIKYKSEVLFELCTLLSQLRTIKNSEMFHQDQYL